MPVAPAPVELILPAGKDGLELFSQTLLNSDIVGHFDGPDFATNSATEIKVPVAVYFASKFAAGAIPTGPTTNLRNAPAPNHAFTVGVPLPTTADNRITRATQTPVSGVPLSDLLSHSLEVGFGASSSGGNAANRMLIVVASMVIRGL